MKVLPRRGYIVNFFFLLGRWINARFVSYLPGLELAGSANAPDLHAHVCQMLAELLYACV